MFVPVLHILAIIGIALDRSKWRSVISPKIATIFLSLTPFGLENIDPRSSKLLTLKFTGVPFRLPSLVTLALIEAEIAGRGRICPPPFPGRVILRPFPVRVLKEEAINMVYWRNSYPTPTPVAMLDEALSPRRQPESF